MAEIQGKIAQANGRLKIGNVGLTIYQRGGKLSLRGTLPPKPGSGRDDPHQQFIPLGINANSAGVSAAEREARRISVLIAYREFTWQPYLKDAVQSSGGGTIRDWIEQFEGEYFQRRKRTDRTETTWRGDYLKVLRQLPQDEILTVEIMKEFILRTPPDTKTRKRVCMVLGSLAKFAQLDGVDFRPYAGKYSPSRVTPRDLPDDKIVSQWFSKIRNPGWRWVYGIIAVYGLRPHEVFHLDYDEIREGSLVISVLDGKTGARRTWPCYPEWYDQFELQNVNLPSINLDRSNTALGSSCTKYFQGLLPFNLYDLRHCWAIRTLEFGLDISLAAQQMGHSVQVHSQQYHHWITDKHHQKAFQALMLRPDRPKPP